MLDISNNGVFTTAILVGKTESCKSKLSLGKKFVDWEVIGELTDYDGPVTLTFENMEKNSAKENLVVAGKNCRTKKVD